MFIYKLFKNDIIYANICVYPYNWTQKSAI